MLSLTEAASIVAALATAGCCILCLWQMSRSIKALRRADELHEAMGKLRKTVEQLHGDVADIGDRIHQVATESALQDDLDAVQKEALGLKAAVDPQIAELRDAIGAISEAQRIGVSEHTAELSQIASTLDTLHERLEEAASRTAALEERALSEIAATEERLSRAEDGIAGLDLESLQAETVSLREDLGAIQELQGKISSDQSVKSRIEQLAASCDAIFASNANAAAGMGEFDTRLKTLADRLNKVDATLGDLSARPNQMPDDDKQTILKLTKRVEALAATNMSSASAGSRADRDIKKLKDRLKALEESGQNAVLAPAPAGVASQREAPVDPGVHDEPQVSGKVTGSPRKSASATLTKSPRKPRSTAADQNLDRVVMLSADARELEAEASEA